MRKYYLIIYVILSISAVQAQENLNAVSAPTSPASSVLDMQPNSGLAPKTYQALEAALYSNFFNGVEGITVPNNFAL